MKPRGFLGVSFCLILFLSKKSKLQKIGSVNAAQSGKKAIFLFGSDSDFSPRPVHAFRKDLSFGKT